MTIDSNEEQYFVWWLEDLERYGYINSFGRAEGYKLANESTVHWTQEKQLKKSTKIEDKSKSLFQDLIYTPDFDVNFDIIGVNKLFVRLYQDLNVHALSGKPVPSGLMTVDTRAIVEIKPNFDFKGMSKKTIILRKLVFEKYGIYINQVIPEKLFKNTFVPQRYLRTDQNKADRKINFKFILIDDMIEQFNKENNEQPNKLF